jgi:hypothetical protein
MKNKTFLIGTAVVLALLLIFWKNIFAFFAKLESKKGNQSLPVVDPLDDTYVDNSSPTIGYTYTGPSGEQIGAYTSPQGDTVSPANTKSQRTYESLTQVPTFASGINQNV